MVGLDYERQDWYHDNHFRIYSLEEGTLISSIQPVHFAAKDAPMCFSHGDEYLVYYTNPKDETEMTADTYDEEKCAAELALLNFHEGVLSEID